MTLAAPLQRQAEPTPLRIAVIGAGLIGVASAHELARDGHQVTVIEQQGSVAEGSSFGQGGLQSLGWMPAWSLPGTPGLPWQPPRLPGWHIGTLANGMRLLRPAPHASEAWMSARHKLDKQEGIWGELRLAWQRLANATQQQQQQSLPLPAQGVLRGSLVLLREASEVAGIRPWVSWLAGQNIDIHLLKPEQAREIEPGLLADAPLHAAVHLPGDVVANGRATTQGWRALADALGVRWRFHRRVESIERLPAGGWRLTSRNQRTVGIGQTDPGTADAEDFDAIVFCAADAVAPLAGGAGLQPGWLPIHGVTFTAALRDLELHPDIGPRAAVIDNARQVVITRQDMRLRVAGLADLGGEPDRLDAEGAALLNDSVDGWFPGATQPSTVQRWKGARHLMPDGLPVIGQTPVPGLWVNTAHGAHGFTLAAGSARLLADLIGGQEAGFEAAPFRWR